MPRKSPFVISLSEEERSELVRRSRQYTSPYRDVIEPRSYSWQARAWLTTSSPFVSTRRARSSASGGGRCERKTGIVPFDRLVAQVMEQEPYRSARRVFWIVDNGSSHRGQAASRRLRAKWPNLILVHTPVHASWLNQVEIYFSIIQRKLLTPNDFKSLAELEVALLQFQRRYEQSAKPFEWTYTRRDLDCLLAKLKRNSLSLAA
jgi:DDE superfamily endonuclease